MVRGDHAYAPLGMDGPGDLDGSLGTRLMIVQPSVWSPDYWYGWSVDGGGGGGGDRSLGTVHARTTVQCVPIADACAWTHMCVHVCEFVHVSVHALLLLLLCVYVCVCGCTCVYVCMCVCEYICVCVCT